MRFASGPAGAVKLSDAATLKWQGGLFLFTQNYDQDAVNNFSPGVLSQFLPFAISQHSPQAALDDTGVGVYGQGTIAFRDRVDLMLGARVDRENRKAALNTFFAPAIARRRPSSTPRSRSRTCRRRRPSRTARGPDAMVYFSVTGGFKAGGFNPASPAGQEAYGEEHTWNYEGGLKSAWAGRRVTTNVSVFSIDWQDLQLNLPNPQVPGQFYISNVGKARSSGAEFELNARAKDGCSVFATFGVTRARFGAGTTSSGLDVSDKKIPNTPDYTAAFGADLSQPDLARDQALRPRRGRLLRRVQVRRGEHRGAGRVLAHQLPVRRARQRACSWKRGCGTPSTRSTSRSRSVRGLAPSGFVGESGRPRTFGLTAGVTF